MKPPRTMREWGGGYVRCGVDLYSRVARLPAGTVFVVEHANEITFHLESVPCERCGISLVVTVKGQRRRQVLEWLGTELPASRDVLPEVGA